MNNTKYCNRCGCALDIFDVQEGLIIHKEKLGYGTKHDGDSVHLQICCRCFDDIVMKCAINPIVVRDTNV